MTDNDDNKKTPETFAYVLDELIKSADRKTTVTSFADQIGKGSTTVYEWLKGERLPDQYDIREVIEASVIIISNKDKKREFKLRLKNGFMFDFEKRARLDDI
ncbi:MAG: hypothetical protein AAF846_12755 [Chloroflexota bacterium]